MMARSLLLGIITFDGKRIESQYRGPPLHRYTVPFPHIVFSGRKNNPIITTCVTRRIYFLIIYVPTYNTISAASYRPSRERRTTCATKDVVVAATSSDECR